MAYNKLHKKDFVIAIKTELPHEITDATNASPIVITSAGHKLENGQKVTVSDVGGNTAANGLQTVANITTDTFELQGTTGNGAYTSGGTWVTAEGVRFKKEAVKGELFYDTGENKLYIAVSDAGSSEATLYETAAFTLTT